MRNTGAVKTCVACAEEIQDKAILCRYCNTRQGELEGGEVSFSPAPGVAENREILKPRVKNLSSIIALIAGIVGVFTFEFLIAPFFAILFGIIGIVSSRRLSALGFVGSGRLFGLIGLVLGAVYIFAGIYLAYQASEVGANVTGQPEATIFATEKPNYLMRIDESGSVWHDPLYGAHLRVCNALYEPYWPTESFFLLSQAEQVAELRERANWIERTLIPSLNVEPVSDVSGADDVYMEVFAGVMLEAMMMRDWAQGIIDFPSATTPFFDGYVQRSGERFDACLALMDFGFENIG